MTRRVTVTKRASEGAILAAQDGRNVAAGDEELSDWLSHRLEALQ